MVLNLNFSRKAGKGVIHQIKCMKKILFLIILILIISNFAKAQYFQTGQDPSSIHWKQINTENFQIIYPEEFENQAQRVALLLNRVYDYGTKTLDFRPRKVSVILHTRTVNSNGLLGWAPKRIELFTTPHQQIYSQDWVEELALHEFRHLVQLDKIESELPILVKAILGEQATAILVGAYLPFWFLEGDAVVTETALSKTGRGRLASFIMDYRAQLFDRGKYSFDKAYLGSYKDYVTDHYRLGYWMVGKTREKYGPEVWENTLQRIGKNPLSLTPMNSTLKKFSGLNSKQTYSTIFDELANDWKRDLFARKIDSVKILSPSKKSFTQYLYPEVYKDSILFAYRTALNDIGRFVLVYPDKSEKVIYTPGAIFEESASMTNNLIIWAERRADIRWTHSERSVIQIYNFETKSIREIKSENKLFSPVISPDLKSFAAVEVDPKNDFYLSVFDLASGKVVERFKTSDNQYFFTPCWDEKGETLYVVCLGEKGKYLAAFDLKTKKLQALTKTTFANLKNPVYKDGRLVFAGDFSGTDNLYTLEIESGKIFEAASVPFGADYPTFSKSGNRLYFSNYTSGGYELATVSEPKNLNLREISRIQLATDSLAENLARQEKGIPDLSDPDSVKFQTKRYSKIGHLFNFHSWAPAYIDVNNYDIRPGFSLFSQNKLGTAETRLGYDYNVSNRTGRYKLGFNYLGWFPEIYTELSAGNEASNYYKVTNTVNSNHEIIKSDTTIERLTWREIRADINIRLPLNLSKGKYSRIFYPELMYSLVNVSDLGKQNTDLNYGNYQTLSYRLYFYNLLNQSSQNILPRWGQQFDVIYRYGPFKGYDLGKLEGIQSALYFPGLSRNSGLKIYQGYQEKNSFSLSDFVRFPRGITSIQNNKVYSLAIDYKFPMFYPDFSIGKLAYVKRVKASLFYDYAWLSTPHVDKENVVYKNYYQFSLNSYGVELTSDLHVLRFFAPVELGCRSIYLPDQSSFRFEVLISVDFNGF